jgi:hypothetical protein
MSELTPNDILSTARTLEKLKLVLLRKTSGKEVHKVKAAMSLLSIYENDVIDH